MSRGCLVKDGRAYVGETRHEILAQVCSIRLVGPTRDIVLSIPGYPDTKYNGYTDEWSEEEAMQDAAKVVLSKLVNDFGFEFFVSTGHNI